jgi:hypothetical protein
VEPLGFAKPDATVPERAFILMNAGLCPSSKGLPKVYLTSPWDEYVHDHIMHPLGNPPPWQRMRHRSRTPVQETCLESKFF